MKALVLLAAIAGIARGEDRLGDFPYRAPIATPGSAPYYRFALPAATYQGAARRDLGDLRVFNSAGQPVPLAIVPREQQSAQPPVLTVAFFPLYADPARSIDKTLLRVERDARGAVTNVTVQEGAAPRRRALIGYLLDASAIAQPLEALFLDWEAAEPFAGQARVDASDDLHAWRTVVAGSPVLYLEHDGARFERHRVELGGARGRYLRLSFTGVPSAFALRQLRLELRPERPALAREWRALAGIESRRTGEWTYDSGGHFPADRVRLHLPQPNAVVQVQILTREWADDAWRLAGSALAYRLSHGNSEFVSADVPVRTNAERYWLVRVDPKGGGAGEGELRLDIGWVPHEVVFAARGPGPFALAYGAAMAGNAKAGNAKLAGPLPADAARATVGAVSANVPEPPSLFREPVRFARAFVDDRDVKKLAAWIVLVAIAGLLSWRALRLRRKSGSATGKRWRI